MIFAVFDVSLIACRRSQVYKQMFRTFIFLLFYYNNINNKVFTLMVNYKPSAFHGHEDTEP